MSTETAGKSGVALMQDQMGTLVEGIETLLSEHKDRKDAAMLLADVRDTITEAVGALHSQNADILMGLQDLQHPAGQPVPSTKRSWWLQGAYGAAAGALLMGGVWWLWPVDPYRTLAIALDTAIVQHYTQLPKPAQDAFDALYKRQGFAAPATRAKGGK